MQSEPYILVMEILSKSERLARSRAGKALSRIAKGRRLTLPQTRKHASRVIGIYGTQIRAIEAMATRGHIVTQGTLSRWLAGKCPAPTWLATIGINNHLENS